MTKEEIINKVHPAAIENNYFKTMYLNSTMEMMDEYAKEVAIGFKKWSDSFYIETGCDTDGAVYHSHVSGESDEKFTEEQLFQSYLQSLKQ